MSIKNLAFQPSNAHPPSSQVIIRQMNTSKFNQFSFLPQVASQYNTTEKNRKIQIENANFFDWKIKTNRKSVSVRKSKSVSTDEWNFFRG